MHKIFQTLKNLPMEFDSSPKSTSEHGPPYERALSLYTNRDNKELEKLFAKHLKKSYDTNFWNLYIEYVKKVSIKKVHIVDVYSFVYAHFEHSYFVYPFVRDYIAELSNAEEDSFRDDKIRKIYHRALSRPIQDISVLWSEYERWESSVDRMAAAAAIEQTRPLYAGAAAVYQRLFRYIPSDDFFHILDIELENPLKLSESVFSSRLSYLFNFYLSRFPDNEALLFLRSFYLPDAKTVPEAGTGGSTFLSIWYSFLYKQDHFNFADRNNSELIWINYFNWLIKNSGMEAFKSKFDEMKGALGAPSYIFVANVEFHQGSDQKGAYQTLQEAFAKFPDDPLVCEEFFGLFLRAGEDDNIRPLFKKLGKTESMWNDMIEYEFLNGDIEEYKSLLVQKNKALRSGEVLPRVELPHKLSSGTYTESLYSSVMDSFGYMHLRLKSTDILEDFLSGLPALDYEENFLCNLGMDEVVELLASI